MELGKRTLGVQKKENLKNDKAKNVNGDGGQKANAGGNLCTNIS